MKRWTDLHWAVHDGKVDKVKQLIGSGTADLSATDARSRTPLYLAVATNRPLIVSTLVAYGADVAALSEKGDTPLHTAMRLFRVEDGEEDEVLEEDDVEVPGNDTNLQMYRASETRRSNVAMINKIQIIKILLAAGADISAKNDVDETPISVAAGYGYHVLIRRLMN